MTLIKLDENLGERGKQLLIDAGHDVATVADQGLSGSQDSTLDGVCRREGRCLVTLDLDFSNPFVFPPEQTAGIAVLRLPGRATPDLLDLAVQTLIAALAKSPIAGKLWIVEPHRIREHLSESNPS